MMYVVDDAADYRFLIQHVFKRFLPQYPLQLFADGLELIQFIERPSDSSPAGLTTPGESTAPADRPGESTPGESTPGLIVLDVDMPKLNGFQTLEQLKRYPLWQSIPVVMMSNRSEPGYQTAATALGASAYLTKPMDIAGLQNVMEQLCHQWLDR